MSSATSSSSSSNINGGGGQFGDTTHTKVFVGGLAWETQKETMKKYFEQFGEILEAVVIFDKNTGRSKGYGFVTFKEAEAAKRACVDGAPVIDGRRANCNIASLGVQRSRPSTPQLGGGGRRRGYEEGKAFSCSPTTTHNYYGIQQGFPFRYSPYYPNPMNYYSCGGSSNHYVVYSTASNSYPFPLYPQSFDFPYPLHPHHFHYSSAGHIPFTPPLPPSQPGAIVTAAPAGQALPPHYSNQTISSI